MPRERNLLFGVFAVQLGKISPQQLAETAAAWAADPSRDLPGRLVESGALAQADRTLLDGLVEAAVQAHGGDAAATLNSFGGEREVERSFGASPGAAAESGPAGAAQVVREAPGRYQHPRLHGRGGMGRILLARDAYLQRDVALKELLPGNGEDAEQPRSTAALAARFAQEARITGQLEHPGIVPVYELGERQDGTLYYTMKFVRGRSLAGAIRDAESPARRLELLSHFVDLAQALAYAHSRGVIHRDVKPGNVMIGAFGETVIIDWGLAKVSGESGVLDEDLAEALNALQERDSDHFLRTKPGRAMGTPAYMAPEQAKGDLDAIDARTDVYALGAVLYELLTGRPPVEGDTLAEVVTKAIRGEVPPVREIEPGAPPELAAICERAMRPDPAQRYQTASELVADVQHYLSGRLVVAYDYRTAEHVRRFARKHWKALTAAGVVLVVGAAALVGHNVQLMRANAVAQRERKAALAAQAQAETAQQAAEEAQEQEEAQRLRAEDEAYAATLQESLRMIKSGQNEAAIERLRQAPGRLRHWAWGRLLRQAAGLPPAAFLGKADIPPGWGPKTLRPSVQFTADGALALWLRPDRSLEVWDVADDSRLFAAPPPGGYAVVPLAWLGAPCLAAAPGYRDAAIHPAGEALLAVTDGQTLRGWRLPGGEPLSLPPSMAQDVNGARFSPGGGVVLTAHEDRRLRQWRWPAFEPVHEADGGDSPPQFCHFAPEGDRYVSQTADGALKFYGRYEDDSTEDIGNVFAGPGAFGDQSIARRGWLLRDRRTKVGVWRLRPGVRAAPDLAELRGFGSDTAASAITLDVRRAVTVTNEGLLDAWDPRAGRRLLRDTVSDILGGGQAIAAAAFTPGARKLALGLSDGRLAFVEAADWEPAAWQRPAARAAIARVSRQLAPVYAQRTVSRAEAHALAQRLADDVASAPAVGDAGLLVAADALGAPRSHSDPAVLARVNGSDATRDGLAAALRDYLNAPKEAPFRQRTLRLETLGYLARTVLLLWPAGDVLWEEDWESGAIHPDFYEIFGVPDPVLKKGVQGPGWALDPNGDSAHDSGVNARRVLDLSQGTYALEWRACLLAGGSKQREFHQAMRIQFCRAGRYQPGRDEPGHLVQVMQFALKADRALTGPILDLKSLAPVNPEHTGKLELGEDDLGRWHALRLELTGNEATVRMNGRTVARADVSRQTLADVQLALKGRSAHCHMLFDDIRLRRLPEGAGR